MVLHNGGAEPRSRPPGSCGKVKAPGITAQDLVARPEPVSREDRGRVVEWLEKALPVGVRRKQADLDTEAKTAGFSNWMLRTAKSILQVKTQKEGFHPAVWWWWREVSTNDRSRPSPSTPTALSPEKQEERAKGRPLTSSTHLRRPKVRTFRHPTSSTHLRIN